MKKWNKIIGLCICAALLDEMSDAILKVPYFVRHKTHSPREPCIPASGDHAPLGPAHRARLYGIYPCRDACLAAVELVGLGQQHQKRQALLHA